MLLSKSYIKSTGDTSSTQHVVQRIQHGYLQLYKKKFSQRQEPSYSFSPCLESSGGEVFNHLYKTTLQGQALGPCIWTSFQSHFWSTIQVSCILSAQFACKRCLVNIILHTCLAPSTSLLSFLITMPSGGMHFHHREQVTPAGLAIHLMPPLLFTRNGKIHQGRTFTCPFRDTRAYSI